MTEMKIRCAQSVLDPGQVLKKFQEDQEEIIRKMEDDFRKQSDRLLKHESKRLKRQKKRNQKKKVIKKTKLLNMIPSQPIHLTGRELRRAHMQPVPLQCYQETVEKYREPDSYYPLDPLPLPEIRRGVEGVTGTEGAGDSLLHTTTHHGYYTSNNRTNK